MPPSAERSLSKRIDLPTALRMPSPRSVRSLTRNGARSISTALVESWTLSTLTEASTELPYESSRARSNALSPGATKRVFFSRIRT